MTIEQIRDCPHSVRIPFQAAERCPFCGAMRVGSGPWALPHLVHQLVTDLDKTEKKEESP